MFIFSNLATSLDGKIATASRVQFWLGTAADHKQMQVLRKKCDVLLFGAGTLRTYHKFCGIHGSIKQPANAIISRSLEGISPRWEFFSDPKKHRILFVTELREIPRSRLKSFEKCSEIQSLLKSKPVAPQAIQQLSKRGFERLLVEGGGDVMWNFASLNLIDEYHVTLTPKIVGGSQAPTLVEGAGFRPEDILKLRLKRCLRRGDELFLTYMKSEVI